ncbi:sulfurtransferase [Steroidobacter sp. S1-65]|uniref:tRNA uridine(34) hydroxylase n=1 Tax=Steroidobacter gossypii TaxID=2805490 RepID=A0ABS1WSA8_9GAMM|nr:sulfurtransferase [Steroidobacter gossypii]MBM0103860.1 sulfurtransferase [Steroidobacter gossypii]
MNPIVNIAAYKFLPLDNLKALRVRLQTLCADAELKGSILLSPEGINLFVAGGEPQIERLLTELRSWPGLADLQPKFSHTDHQPFRRMLVRIKREIIAFGVPGIDPARRTSPKLAARQLKQWLDEGRPITLLDTRNDYEIKLGTFKNALPIGVDHFRDFPAAVAKLPEELKEQTVVMFCTGGIRCEKAGPYMEQVGFKNILQLDGGILKYFEEVGGEHYQGECFVFDQRVGLDPKLSETQSAQCFQCQSPLTQAEQEHPHYVPGRSCPYCFKTPAEQMAANIARRHETIRKLITPLPGSQPYDHYKPVNVPVECDGQTIVETLYRVVRYIPIEVWEQKCADGLILTAEKGPVAATHRVRTGERYLHRLPAVIEPAVNMDVRILHEDEAIVVVNKPAPLPVHSGGRFYRNTLQWLLFDVYAPQKLRPAHRLDANTTGVQVLTRTRHFAGLVQDQFAQGQVDKVYLVRVKGHPEADEFVCMAPISKEPGKVGSRSVDLEDGLPSHTDFRVLQRFGDGTALLEARPRTGRTNQIRIHAAHLGWPVCGDPAYFGGNEVGETQTLSVDAPPLCLHAFEITFRHPVSRQPVTFRAPPPAWAAAAS